MRPRMAMTLFAVPTLGALFVGARFGEQVKAGRDEMRWFDGVVGEWQLDETVQLSPDVPITRASKRSHIYFLPDRSTIAVEDVALDRSNVFLGFHAFSPDSSRYINWGVGSGFYQGWGHGTITEGGALSLAGEAFDPRSPSRTLQWRGDWRKENAKRLVFRAYVRMADGRDFLIKESVYSR